MSYNDTPYNMSYNIECRFNEVRRFLELNFNSTYCLLMNSVCPATVVTFDRWGHETVIVY